MLLITTQFLIIFKKSKAKKFSRFFKCWLFQRYFYNGQYYKGNGPAILFLGGEGPENGGWIFDEGCPHMKWANDSSAALFALEHRFYGKSRPFE